MRLVPLRLRSIKLPAIGAMLSGGFSCGTLSLVFAPVGTKTNGRSLGSVISWRFVRRPPLSVRFRPVWSPGYLAARQQAARAGPSRSGQPPAIDGAAHDAAHPTPAPPASRQTAPVGDARLPPRRELQHFYRMQLHSADRIPVNAARSDIRIRHLVIAADPPAAMVR